MAQVGKIERIRRFPNGKVEQEISYFVTSLGAGKADASRLLRHNRNHWTIENKSHWVRDTVYDEDRSQVRTRNGPRMMAALRNVSIGIIRLFFTIKSVARALREIAARPHLALRLIGV